MASESQNSSILAREDWWSEEATLTLISAWGKRFLQLNRGNLRQKHWQEVANAVNANRTDVQCKNRIDTLKKKYKAEKAKLLKLGHHNYISPWPFFTPLDSLIGTTIFKPPPPPPALPPPPSSVPVGRRSKRPSTHTSFFRRNFSVMAAAAAAAIDGEEDDSDTNRNVNGNLRRRLRVEKDDGGDPYHQLAEAIGRFAEVYERVEEAKQRQMVELEKQRMQFTKDLELQRIKLLMESQLQLEKLKRSNTNSEPDFYRSDEGDHSTSIN